MLWTSIPLKSWESHIVKHVEENGLREAEVEETSRAEAEKKKKTKFKSLI